MGLQNIEFYTENRMLPLTSVYQLKTLTTRSKNMGPENSHKKGSGCLTEILKRTPEPGIKIL